MALVTHIFKLFITICFCCSWLWRSGGRGGGGGGPTGSGEQRYEYCCFVIVRYPCFSDGERRKRKGGINQDGKRKMARSISGKEAGWLRRVFMFPADLKQVAIVLSVTSAAGARGQGSAAWTDVILSVLINIPESRAAKTSTPRYRK